MGGQKEARAWATAPVRAKAAWRVACPEPAAQAPAPAKERELPKAAAAAPAERAHCQSAAKPIREVRGSLPASLLALALGLLFLCCALLAFRLVLVLLTLFALEILIRGGGIAVARAAARRNVFLLRRGLVLL